MNRIYHLPVTPTDPRLDPYREQLEKLQLELQARILLGLRDFQDAVENLTGLVPLIKWNWTWEIRSPDLIPKGDQ